MLMNSKECEVRITSMGSLTDILTSILNKSNSETSVKCHIIWQYMIRKSLSTLESIHIITRISVEEITFSKFWLIVKKEP